MKNETNETRGQFVTDGEEMYEEDQHLKENLVLYVSTPKFYGRFILTVICYDI
jgi:hypothetical protein